jgi:hypothetical protein
MQATKSIYQTLSLFRFQRQFFAWQPKPVVFKDWKIVKGDQVQMIAGKYKGQ